MKYEITQNTKEIDGRILYQIRSLVNFRQTSECSPKSHAKQLQEEYKLEFDTLTKDPTMNGKIAAFVSSLPLTSFIPQQFGSKDEHFTLVYDVKEGDLGGYIESETNLSREGECWIFPNAFAFGTAIVKDDATLYSGSSAGDGAVISGKSEILRGYIENEIVHDVHRTYSREDGVLIAIDEPIA